MQFGLFIEIMKNKTFKFLSISFWPFFFFFFFLVFLGPCPLHTEVPRLGVELELQPQQHRNQAETTTYTTAHGNTRSLTH